jgi:predicted transcriptional regulator
MSAHDTDTVTVRVDRETKAQLEELARHTRRSKSFLAGEAIADYVQRELAIVAGIQRGLEDVRAGRTVPHEVAKKRIMETIARAERAQKK